MYHIYTFYNDYFPLINIIILIHYRTELEDSYQSVAGYIAVLPTSKVDRERDKYQL